MTGEPITTADELAGNNRVEVKIGKKHFNLVTIAGGIAFSDSMIVMSHFKDISFQGSEEQLKISVWPVHRRKINEKSTMHGHFLLLADAPDAGRVLKYARNQELLLKPGNL